MKKGSDKSKEVISRVNSSVSIDIVLFGFDGVSLKVALVNRRKAEEYKTLSPLKLPGSMIHQDEDIDSAAKRVLLKYTGLSTTKLRQLTVFSDPNRVNNQDLEWIKAAYNIETERVVTILYFGAVMLNEKSEKSTAKYGTTWSEVDSVKNLGLDHKEIAAHALEKLSFEFIHSPIAFELLPKKFTIRQLQTLYEAVLGIEIDNRNFRKKISSLGYLTLTTEKELGVAHKPARFYTFNKTKYERASKNRFKVSKLDF